MIHLHILFVFWKRWNKTNKTLNKCHKRLKKCHRKCIGNKWQTEIIIIIKLQTMYDSNNIDTCIRDSHTKIRAIRMTWALHGAAFLWNLNLMKILIYRNICNFITTFGFSWIAALLFQLDASSLACRSQTLRLQMF